MSAFDRESRTGTFVNPLMDKIFRISCLLMTLYHLIDGVRVAATAVIGVFLIAGACEGYLYRKIAIPVRILMMAGAVLLISSFASKK